MLHFQGSESEARKRPINRAMGIKLGMSAGALPASGTIRSGVDGSYKIVFFEI